LHLLHHPLSFSVTLDVTMSPGIDATHNPEFSTCELYWAYADCRQLIPFTETLLRRLAFDLLGTHRLRLPWAAPSSSSSSSEPVMVDFAPAFQQLDIVPELERALGQSVTSILPQLNRNDPAAIQQLVDWARQAGVPPSELPAPPVTAARLFDKLIGYFLEPKCVQVRVRTFSCHPFILVVPLTLIVCINHESCFDVHLSFASIHLQTDLHSFSRPS
jgi:lysyl-tRNA synthetase class II